MDNEKLVFIRNEPATNMGERRAMVDYGTPNPDLLERIRDASDDELSRYLENAKAKLPAAQWLVDAVVTEQFNRGGLRNMNANTVRDIILRYARQGVTCTYKTIANELGIEWNQAHRRMPVILGQVSELEHQAGRPLLTAIVVSQSGRCGNGFFEMVRRNGVHFVDERKFELEEQQRVFEFWASQ